MARLKCILKRYNYIPQSHKCVTVLKVKEMVIKMGLVIIHFSVFSMAKTMLLSLSG